jgi:hypothetical protein
MIEELNAMEDSTVFMVEWGWGGETVLGAQKYHM